MHQNKQKKFYPQYDLVRNVGLCVKFSIWSSHAASKYIQCQVLIVYSLVVQCGGRPAQTRTHLHLNRVRHSCAIYNTRPQLPNQGSTYRNPENRSWVRYERGGEYASGLTFRNGAVPRSIINVCDVDGKHMGSLMLTIYGKSFARCVVVVVVLGEQPCCARSTSPFGAHKKWATHSRLYRD